MKKIIGLIFVIFMTLTLVGCEKKDNIASLNVEDIEKIVVTLAMGNPDYGADSKTITDKMEIQQMVELFNSAELGQVVAEDDLEVATTSTYAFYDDEKCLRTFEFNGNNSEILFWENEAREVIYEKKTPYTLYNESVAEVVLVDSQGNELDVNSVSIINPLLEVDNADAFVEAFDIEIDALEGSVDVSYYILADEIAQIIFVLDEKEFVLRASKTISGTALSGIHGDFEMNSYVACGDKVSITVDTASLKEGKAFSTSTVEIFDEDTIYLSLVSENTIESEEISSMIEKISYSIADKSLEDTTK